MSDRKLAGFNALTDDGELNIEGYLKFLEQNQQMADLLRATCAAGDAATKALDAAVRAQMCADKIDDMFHSIRAQLKEIRAKKELGIRLSQKERAIWTLYGEASK